MPTIPWDICTFEVNYSNIRSSNTTWNCYTEFAEFPQEYRATMSKEKPKTIDKEALVARFGKKRAEELCSRYE